jgi:hypothetical protein
MAAIRWRLGLAALMRTCLGELASHEDYLPLKPMSQAASTAQAGAAMRVGSSELFGSLGDAQGAARASWRAVLRGRIGQLGGPRETNWARKDCDLRQAQCALPRRDEREPPLVSQLRRSGLPVRKDHPLGDEAGIGFERTGI